MIQAPIVSNLESLFASARYNYLSTLPSSWLWGRATILIGSFHARYGRVAFSRRTEDPDSAYLGSNPSPQMPCS